MRWLPLLALLSCAAPELRPAPGLPPSAEAVVLLAGLDGDRVTVGGTLTGTEQHVDLDAPTDDRYAFRYQIVADGEVRYERTTSGPVLVDAFLDYWSGVAGVDVLAAVPTLGRFAVTVPILDGADEVRFQLRQDDGTFAEAGSFDLSGVDALDVGLADDIVAGHATLHDAGPPSNRLDLVIVGDGYTADEQDLFREHARKLKRRLLETEPLASYADYLSIRRVDVVSEESGASYDCVGGSCGPVDNALGSIFAIELVNLVTGSSWESRAIFQADQWRVAQAVSVVPADHVIVLVNSRRFGGMAVHYATATTGVVGWKETAVHELGHVLGQLGDEYVFDDCIRSDALGLPANVADDPERLPWAHWIDPGTELPTSGGDGVGAYAGAYNCDDLYRPQATCKMRDSGEFCAVCTEQLIRRFFRYADPVDEVEITGGRRPRITVRSPGDVAVRWLVDGEEGGTARGDEPFVVRLGGGERLTLEVREETDRVRVDDGDLLQVIEYDIP